MTDRFIAAMAEALEKDAGTMQMSDRFKEYAEWDSLAVLSVMAVVEESFGVVLSRHDLDESVTLADLFGRVSSRSG